MFNLGIFFIDKNGKFNFVSFNIFSLKICLFVQNIFSEQLDGFTSIGYILMLIITTIRLV